MDSRKEVQHVYLVGAKSLGAYGGYETFVYKLTEYHQNKENIKYHVACKANGDGCMDENKFEGVTKINDHEFELHNAHCFKIDIPQIGPAQAIYYDVAALKACCEHIRKNHIPHPIVYIMACRIGPFAGHFYKEIHKLGGKVYLNPDGHEWMRAKWSAPIRKYWKISEQMMVKYCDLAICDSVNIEKYIHECYDGKGIKGRNPKTTFIAYGADLTLSKLADNDEKLVSWYKEKGLTKKNYYLVVGRFVPENSFEVMIREFMKSNSQKDFALITNVNDKFLNELEEKLHFKSDDRIKFVGTVYDQELLKKIRENKPSVVVNLAAQAGVRYSITNPDAYVESNLVGFFNILEACRHCENLEHLVYASSSSVYGSNKKVPYSTDDKVDNPVSLYAATKKSNELMAHAYSKLYNIPSTGLRFFTVYGPAGRPDMAYFGFTNKLVKGETIKIFNYGNCKRDFTYVDDIVEGVVRVMKKTPDKKNGEDGLPIPPYAVYNIGNQNPENLLDFVQILSEELVRAKVLPEDYDFETHKELVPMQPGDVPVTYADTSALERDFGYKPSTSLRTGLRNFAEWYAGFYK